MERRIKFFTQVEIEARIASLSVFLYGEGKAKVSFEGEERIVDLTEDGRREDFFIVDVRLWNGKKDPNLYSFFVDDKEYRIGFRNFGIDKMRGFFLNGVAYPLTKDNTVITEDVDVLDKCDKEGVVCAYLFSSNHVPTNSEVAILSSHPSLFFWGYRVENESVEELKRLNSILYSLDKTRATIGVFEKDSCCDSFDVGVIKEKKGEGKQVVALRDGEGFIL